MMTRVRARDYRTLCRLFFSWNLNLRLCCTNRILTVSCFCPSQSSLISYSLSNSSPGLWSTHLRATAVIHKTASTLHTTTLKFNHICIDSASVLLLFSSVWIPGVAPFVTLSTPRALSSSPFIHNSFLLFVSIFKFHSWDGLAYLDSELIIESQWQFASFPKGDLII
jgi:hypothetical protein